MKKLIYSLIVIGFIFSSCGSGIKVTSQYDQNVNFNEFKTYSYLGWSEGTDKMLNDFDKKRIESAFIAEFKARNMEYVKEGGDIEVSLYLVTDNKTATTAYTDYYGGYRGYYYGRPWGWGGGFATTTYDQYDYTVGTLVCDVFQASDKQLIWQGVGSGTINEDASKRDKNIPIAVNKLMSLYPVSPGK